MNIVAAEVTAEIDAAAITAAAEAARIFVIFIVKSSKISYKPCGTTHRFYNIFYLIGKLFSIVKMHKLETFT